MTRQTSAERTHARHPLRGRKIHSDVAMGARALVSSPYLDDVVTQKVPEVSKKPRRRPGYRSAPAVAVVVVLGLFGLAGPQAAWADGGEATDEGYVMVQGAISFLVNDPSELGREQALAMVDDALAAEDQDGVAVDLLAEGRAALESGQVDEARQLLQDSIAEAVENLEPATGAETGTGEMLPPLESQSAVVGFDWLFLAVSAFAALVGAALAYLFRPRENLAELRHDILAARATVQDRNPKGKA